jgi:hypothetical protein
MAETNSGPNGTVFPTDKSSCNSKPPVSLPAANRGQRPCSTVEAIRKNEQCPNRFRLIARIVDFYPLHLDECVVLRCMKCKKEYVHLPTMSRLANHCDLCISLETTRKRCLNCDDMADSYVKSQYHFYFLVEDKGGERLNIIITDPEVRIVVRARSRR